MRLVYGALVAAVVGVVSVLNVSKTKTAKNILGVRVYPIPVGLAYFYSPGPKNNHFLKKQDPKSPKSVHIFLYV